MADLVMNERAVQASPDALGGEQSLLSRVMPLQEGAGTMPELDGLRGMAVLMTVVYHLELYLPRVARPERAAIWLRPDGKVLSAFGATGVHLFFVLSGFLLFKPYAITLLSGTPFPDTRRFFLRRALRILPAYWASLVIVVLFWKTEYLSAANRSNLFLHVFLAHDWSQKMIETINPPFWTMAVECQFYLLLPLLSYAILRLFRARSSAALTCLLLAIAASPLVYTGILAVLTRFNESSHSSAFYPVGFLSVFASGCLASLIVAGLELGTLPAALRAKSDLLAKVAGGVGAGFLALHFCLDRFGASLMNEHGHRYWLIGMPLVSLGYGGLLLGTVSGFPAWKRVFSARPLRFLGAMSYSLYIWNVPLLALVVLPLATRLRSPEAILAVATLGVLVIMIPLSYLSFLLVERPFFSLRRRKRATIASLS